MLNSLLKRIAQGLDAHSIPYMIIGGQAVLLYGEPRQTKDIDVTLGIGPDHVEDVVGIAAESGWSVLAERPREFAEQTFVLPCLDPGSGLRIDFIFSASVYEAQALSRCRHVTMDDATVCYASPEDLVIHKIVAGRPRDLEDVRNVLLKNPNLDMGYVRNWLKQFEDALDNAYLARLDAVAEDAKN